MGGNQNSYQFFLFGLLVLIAGCHRVSGDLHGDGEGQGLTIKAMTFNIRVPADAGDKSWERRGDVAARVLTSRKPDVVGFQEMVPKQRDDMLAAANDYAAFGLGRENDKGGESCSVFYLKQRWDIDQGQAGTFWYSDTPEAPGSSHWGNKWVRICTWARLVDKETGRGFYIYNSHFDFSEDFHLRAAGMLQQRMARRTHMAEPVIVMGDFNARPDGKGLAWLLDKERPVALEDAWGSARPGEDGFTFHHFSGIGRARIDYLLYSKGSFSVSRAEVIYDHEGDVWPSDHFPVWAEFSFR
jgi:endonuclease/exonuclease/phosphatase family metal-dependent hydrolase